MPEKEHRPDASKSKPDPKKTTQEEEGPSAAAREQSRRQIEALRQDYETEAQTVKDQGDHCAITIGLVQGLNVRSGTIGYVAEPGGTATAVFKIARVDDKMIAYADVQLPRAAIEGHKIILNPKKVPDVLKPHYDVEVRVMQHKEEVGRPGYTRLVMVSGHEIGLRDGLKGYVLLEGGKHGPDFITEKSRPGHCEAVVHADIGQAQNYQRVWINPSPKAK